MKISIVGSRGIPNQYGGFEQFADILSQGLVKKGHEVTVYSSSNHPYKENIFNGVNLIHKFDPENKIGTAGQFIYDLMCISDVRKRDFDIIYMLGYTSNSVWQKFIYNKGAILVTNMDGLEWKRSKYSSKVQRFLKYAEKLAVKYSNYLIADSTGIKNYLKKEYNAESTYIPYGSFIFNNPTLQYLQKNNLSAYEYDILIARFEPENNIEMIMEAHCSSDTSRSLILIGGYKNTDFGKYLYQKYSTHPSMKFLGAVYDQEELNNLRHYSNLYFHGHSVGGTNPSLLEAMGSSALICYHGNEFNSAIVGADGFPFTNSQMLTGIINTKSKKDFTHFIQNNLKKIELTYNWENIINQYDHYFSELLSAKETARTI